MNILLSIGKVIGWAMVGGVVAGVPAFILTIIASNALTATEGDPATRGLSGPALAIELGFVFAVLAGISGGTTYGIVRARRSRTE